MSAAFSPGPTYADTGGFLSDCKFLDGPDAVELGAPEYGEKFYSAAGVDGSVRKAFGFRGRRIALRVVYVAATADAVVAAFDSDMAAIANAASTLVLHGATYYGCFLDPRATRLTGLTGNGSATTAKVLGRATVVVNSKRLS